MKTATRALMAFWIIAFLSITAALIISAHYLQVSADCAAMGGNQVNGICQIEAP